MKINSMQAPSTLIPEYIGSDFDAVLEVASNIEVVNKEHLFKYLVKQ